MPGGQNCSPNSHRKPLRNVLRVSEVVFGLTAEYLATRSRLRGPRKIIKIMNSKWRSSVMGWLRGTRYAMITKVVYRLHEETGWLMVCANGEQNSHIGNFRLG